MTSHYRWLIFIIVLTAAALYVALPLEEPAEFLLRDGDEEAYQTCINTIPPPEDCDEYQGTFEYQLGLDLVGGLRVLLQAELPDDAYTTDELASDNG